MTAPELDLLDALAQVVGADHLAQVRSWPRIVDPASNYDEATLRRSFAGLSKWARREQRRPVPIRVDEYGWGSNGRYYASQDGAA